MGLTNITLHGFKSIRRLDNLALGPMNVLIGANGAGKSNLIGFFRLIRSMMGPDTLQLSLARMGGANACLFDGAAVTPQIEARLCFNDDQARYEYSAKLVHAAPDRLIFADEAYHFTMCDGSASPQSVSLGTGHQETRLIDYLHKEDGIAEMVSRRLQWQWEIYQFHNTSATARIRQRSSVEDSVTLQEDGGNLAPILLRLRNNQPRAYQRIVANIRQIIPWFDNFELEPDGHYLLLRWRERGSGMVFGPHQASDGTLRIMALVTLLLQPVDWLPYLMILDEPELGLHPAALTLVSGLIQAVSRSCQVIIATQSMPLLDHFDPGDVITVSRPERESSFTRVDPERLREWLEEYSLGELWEKNVLGAGPWS